MVCVTQHVWRHFSVNIFLNIALVIFSALNKIYLNSIKFSTPYEKWSAWHTAASWFLTNLVQEWLQKPLTVENAIYQLLLYETPLVVQMFLTAHIEYMYVDTPHVILNEPDIMCRF